ncbi:GntR family transcriptional regulator [Caballeronia telluris]|uniref:GntR family transcriptional regulator n=1 Tax=Caballeronia telluris TaxID=326475 RepID=A0A158JZ20_9BURK|nr:GntR family transcriptional regulator [Caballeronia telluris]SAL73985.1 GntR family transcriptional regulator [Caballeronia telluris]
MFLASTGATNDAAAETETRLRYRLIYEQLKTAIERGRIVPGLVLLEGPVARVFGTSRVPVRKAFEMLHEAGLLHTFEGRGYLAAAPGGRTHAPVRTPLSDAVLGFDTAPAPLDLRSTSERIYHALEDAVSNGIVFGHFRIDETEAAEVFGCSRGVVREALGRLRDLGLVEKSAYSHWLCGPLTARAVAEDYELRALLEPAALRTSAPHLPESTLEAALAEIERAIDCPASINADALARIETTLHVECLRYAPNRKLLETIGRALMPLTVNHAFFQAFDIQPEVGTLMEHRVVLDHLRGGGFEAAAIALNAHLQAGRKRTLQRLKVLAVLPEPALPAFMKRIA